MNINKVLIILFLVLVIVYSYYILSQSADTKNKRETPDKIIVESPTPQYYQIYTITHDVILQILNGKFIKYRPNYFNLNNLPVSTQQLNIKESKKICNTITNVFNSELKNKNIKLEVLNCIPLYKMETDIESTYTIQFEYEVKSLEPTINVENKLLMIQISLIIIKKNPDETFFDKVIGNETEEKIEKIFITQIKKIASMNISFDVKKSDDNTINWRDEVERVKMAYKKEFGRF